MFFLYLIWRKKIIYNKKDNLSTCGIYNCFLHIRYRQFLSILHIEKLSTYHIKKLSIPHIDKGFLSI